MFIDRRVGQWHEANTLQYVTGTNLKQSMRQTVREKYCTDCVKKDSCKLAVRTNLRGQLFCKEEEVKL